MIEFWANRSFHWGKIHLWIRNKSDRHIALAQELTFRVPTPEEEGMERPPTMALEVQEARQLMDQLWESGIRPTAWDFAHETKGTGEIRHHLEDMRQIAFGKLNIQKP